MRILLTGVNGQVGFELQSALASLGEVIALTRQDMNLADAASIVARLDHYNPDIIVNPAAYTAVDKAETEHAQALAVNAEAPAVMARWVAQHNALLVHYSTDYVFDGCKDGAYVETDPTNPQSVYGASKCRGEEAIRQATDRHVILRTSWVFGAYGNNFLKTILRLARERDSLTVVADQFGAPTSAALIAGVTAEILRQYQQSTAGFAYGTYHLAAAGVTSWYDYARFLVQHGHEASMPLRLSPEAIQPIPATAYPAPAARPANSRLDCSKLAHNFGLVLPDWRQGVIEVMARL